MGDQNVHVHGRLSITLAYNDTTLDAHILVFEAAGIKAHLPGFTPGQVQLTPRHAEVQRITKHPRPGDLQPGCGQ